MRAPLVLAVALSVVATLPSVAAGQQRADAAASAASPLVVGETFTIRSAALGEVRRINVWLPPEHASSAEARLPVLYMPDGGIGEDFPHVMGLLQISALNGTMRPMILVGIENTERRRDMTGPTESAEDRKIAPRVGGSAAFRRFVRDELVPEIERRYRTSRERAIVGESLAGLFVVETLLLEPDLFDTYVAIDPSLWWNDGRFVEAAGARLRALRATGKTLWLASGSEQGNQAVTSRFEAVLARDAPPGIAWHHERMPAETHATIFHPAALRAFRAVLKPARP